MSTAGYLANSGESVNFSISGTLESQAELLDITTDNINPDGIVYSAWAIPNNSSSSEGGGFIAEINGNGGFFTIDGYVEYWYAYFNVGDGGAIPQPTDLEKNGYIFAEWDPTLTAETVITSDTTFTAQWQPTWGTLAATANEGTDYTMDADGNLQIHTAAGLAYFAEQVNSGTNLFENATVVLTADINLMDAGVGNYSGEYNESGEFLTLTETNSWPAIGTMLYQFKGTFDGQGHTVSNVYIYGNDYYAKGLFSYTASSAVIQNVGVIDSHIVGDFKSAVLSEVTEV